jgi:diguanylate cyclase (GGDEF)-like protein/PAS domain S-box-containing protein
MIHQVLTGSAWAADLPADGARLRAALDALPDAFWLVEPVRDERGAITDFVVVDLNIRAAVGAGVNPDAARGALLGELVPGARGLGHIEVGARVVETGRPEVMEFRLDPPGGPPVWRSAQAVKVGGGVAFTVRDVSERVSLEEARRTADADVRLLAENATDMICRVTPEGVATYVSPASREIVGFEPHELVGRTLVELVHPDDVHLMMKVRAELRRAEAVRSSVYRVRSKNGGWAWLESACRGVRDADGRLVEIQVSTRDVSARAMADAEHVALNRVSEAVAAGASGDALHGLVAAEVARLLGADGGRVVRYLDGDVAEILGVWRRDGLPQVGTGTRIALRSTWAIAQVKRTGATAVSVLSAEDAGQAGADLRVGLAAPVRLGAELWGAVAAALADPDDVPPGAVERVERFAKLVGIAVANADARDRLTAQATTDGLTGLANHATFHTALIDAFALAERHRRPLSLALIDLDHFKTVNDTLGHRAGDAALTVVAGIISTHARRTDLVARTGGEEMAWLLPETSVPAAARAAERLRRAIAAAPIAAPLGLTASIGIAERSPYDRSAEVLFRRADSALYRAKNLGRDRVLTA